MPEASVLQNQVGEINIITINRPNARNAVDPTTAKQLRAAFIAGEENEKIKVHILTGAEGNFCAGADLKAVADGAEYEQTSPMGPSWLDLSKPSIAAVEGYAVAGGLELACLCDLRVAAQSSIFGVFCRRWGVPLIDGGTVRLPRLIGQSRAMDMILTGRPVNAEEALSFGLANRVVSDNCALEEAINLAEQLCSFPQTCMRNDRQSALSQWGSSVQDALEHEATLGKASLAAGASAGAGRFAEGKGRSGNFENI